jgi:hypothetical protein
MAGSSARIFRFRARARRGPGCAFATAVRAFRSGDAADPQPHGIVQRDPQTPGDPVIGFTFLGRK